MNKVNELRNEFKKIERTAAEVFSTYFALTRSLCNIYAILADAVSANCRTGRTGRTGRTNAGTDGAANCRGKIEEPERLPDIPDWRDGASRQEADDRLTQIRLIVAAHQGDGLAEIIEAIKADGTDPKALAAILGVNQARISEALHGKARPGFVARFAEVLGCNGDSANCRTGRTGRTGRTNAGSKAEGK